MKEIKTKWDLNCFFKNDNDPEIERGLEIVKKKNYEFINKWKDRTDYLEKPEVLKEALDEYENLACDSSGGGNAGYYFWLRSKLNQNDSEIKARNNKIEDFVNKIDVDIDFFEIRIAKVDIEKQKEFLNSPELKEYKHLLEKLFENAKYILTEPEEKILTLKSPTSYSNWVRMVSDFLSKEEREILNEKGEKEVKNFSEVMSTTHSKNKKVRDSAGIAVNDILEKHSDVAEHEINSVLGDKKINDELRGIERPDLSRHISDDIDTEVVDLMSEIVVDNFDIAKKYYELKSKLMGVSKLEYHERNVEYGSVDKEYSYEDTINLVKKVFGELDNEFSEILDGFSENGRIDVFPQKGKSDGAFCVGWGKLLPSFILLNHDNSLKEVLTFAHEMGHGINNILMQKKQNALSCGIPLSTAEVASTFFEDFVLEEILKEADDELRLAIMMQKLNSDISTIFRQIACYRFEQELHKNFREKGYLSKKEIGELFQKHMASYMGDFVEQSPGSENWWVYWGHIRKFFYNYSYANGLLISKALQKSVKEDSKFILKVKEFLSAGTSDSPKNIFKKLDIDIEDRKFWENGVDEVKKLLEETEELARKLGKI